MRRCNDVPPAQADLGLSHCLSARMTFCFVVSVPGIVIAAADTRITLHYDGGVPVDVDGPNDFHVDVTSLGRTVVFPYRQRKIRFLGAGWAVAAGEYASARLVLQDLSAAKASRFDVAQAHLDRVREALEERARHETGVPTEQLRRTLVIGGDLSEVGTVWMLGFNPNDPRTHPNAGQAVANTPLDVPAAVSQAAEQVFQDELQRSCHERNAIGLVKAAAKRIGMISQHTKEASARAQIGVTIKDPGGGFVARYFDGAVEELLKLGPADFFRSSEAAA